MKTTILLNVCCSFLLLGCVDSLKGDFNLTDDPEGYLDTTFASVGYITLDSTANGNANDGGSAVVVDANDKILVTGYSTNGSGNKDMVVWRFLPTGALDTDFGTGGFFIHDSAAGGSGEDEGLSITLSSTGEIFVSGYSENGSNRDEMTVWKLTPTGALDTSFNTTGFLTYVHASSGASEGERGRKIILDSAGRLVIFGQGYFTNDKSFKIWRYTASGALDTSFSGDGIFENHSPAGGGGADKLFGGAIASDGSMFGGGYSWSGPASRHNMAGVKIDSSGNLSTDFNTTGLIVHNSAAGGDDTDLGLSATLDLNERLLIAGKSVNGAANSDAAVWCYGATGALDTSFNGDGIFIINDIAGGDDEDVINDVIVSSKASVFVAGQSMSSTDYEMFVLKLDTNGELDTAFADSGTLVFQSIAGNDVALGMTFDNSGKLIIVGKINNGTDSDMAVWRIK